MTRPSKRTMRKRPPSPEDDRFLLLSSDSKKSLTLIVVIGLSVLVLAVQVFRMPAEVPILLSQTTSISIVEGSQEGAHISISSDLQSPASRTNTDNKQSKDVPADWNEMLRLRRKFQQKPDPAAPPAPAQPAAQQQQQQQQQQPAMINGLPAILLKTDALYQKGTWDKSPIIIEKYKLVFFTVPKVGCTGFKQLFRRMMGHQNWMDHQYYSEPFLPHNPATNGLKYLSDYSFERANEMLTSPEWTRAIFVRKPEERVLSAYLDKAAYSKGYYLRMRCCDKFPPGSEQHTLLQCSTGTKQYTEPAPGEQNIPIMGFEDFLTKLVPQCDDPHWEPQAIRMAPKYWERISFVGRFEHLFEDTKRLLVQIGAWQEFGASGWVVNGVDGAIFDPKQKALHGTKARDDSSKDQYYTAPALQSIVKYYEKDYHHSVMSFPAPSLAAAQS